MGGLAVGAASIICPAYISEIAPSAVRGRLASLQQLAIVLGLFFAFFSNYLFAGAAGTAASPFWFGFQAWQWMFWAEIIPAAVFLLGLLFIPESPRYLVAANRAETGRTVLARLGHPDPNKKVREIQETLRMGNKPRVSDLYDPVRKKFVRFFGSASVWQRFSNLSASTSFFITAKFCGGRPDSRRPTRSCKTLSAVRSILARPSWRSHWWTIWAASRS